MLRQGPLRSLNAPPDSLAMAGRRCKNKKEGKVGGREAEKKGKSISLVRSCRLQPPICVTELLRTQRGNGR